MEEFMLLANMSVAGVIARAFPDQALLRRHPPPNQRKMQSLCDAAAGLVRVASLLPATSRCLDLLRTVCINKMR